MDENEATAKKDPLKHKCAICPYSTTIRKYLTEHLKIHSTEKSFKCSECPYTAIRNKYILRHSRLVHQTSRPFPCPHSGCNYAAKIKSMLKTHLKSHSVEKSFSCSHPNCNYSTNRNGDLTAHTRVHTGEKPFVCQFESCSYASATRIQLVTHTRTHTKEKPFKCPEPNCEFAFTQTNNLKKHRLTHSPQEGEERPLFPCPICEYKGKSNQLLVGHMKSHSSEKPFSCSFELCEFRCKYKRALEVHLKTHSAEKQYKCELCPFRAKQRSTVTSHLSSVHSDFRPFKCTEPKCDYAAKTTRALQQHLVTHPKDKMHYCSFPGCKFLAVNKYNVNRHAYHIHSEEKKEKCMICLYKCKTKSDLTVHMRTHTKEEPYKCKENGCEYRSKTSSGLRQHEIRNHTSIFKQK